MKHDATKTICVFCGAKAGNDPSFARAATEIGRSIAERGHRLAYGGGNVGLMGAVADGALAAGGEVLGIIPHKLLEREMAHKGIQQMEIVADMATRKDRMMAVSDAFLSLPGGLGTLDELFEVLTLRQIGYHQKPSAVLNLNDYYTDFLNSLQGFAAKGLIDRRELERLLVAATPQQVLDQLEIALSSAPA
jgi:uncharacterized protein (TIGR00730 family)